MSVDRRNRIASTQHEASTATRRRTNTVHFRLLSGLLLLLTLVVLAYGARAEIPAAADGLQVPSLAPMLQKVTPAVVNISTKGHVTVQSNPLMQDPFFRQFFNIPNVPLERKFQSLGSGVIVDAKRGLVLTNNHVIANADQITVTLRDGRHLKAKLVGTDPETDIAVIKIHAKHLTELKLANSDKLRVGDFVVAIGNPFGLGQTVTSGIVSALGRSGLGIEGYEDFIQTDASINPGNSGGALVNLRGELVGINTAIVSRSGGNIGIGFAIPSNMARDIMEQIVKYGKVKRGYLGAQLQNLTPDLASAFGISEDRGAVLVSVVPDSPAAKAGLKPGDVIVKVDGKSVPNAEAVRTAVGLLRVGDKVHFEILRNGQKHEITATVAPHETAAAAEARHPGLAGATFSNIPSDYPGYGTVHGVLIARVKPNSNAWESGLRKDYVISSLNRIPLHNLKQFKKLVEKSKGPLLLQVQRGDMAAFLVVK